MPITLNQIADGIALPIRRVRYVPEHRILPGTELRSEGHRVTRSFTGFEGFGIACAAMLLECGLRRQVVTTVMRSLLAAPTAVGNVRLVPLMRAYSSHGQLRLDIADGVNYRLPAVSLSGETADRWVQSATGAALDKDYQPLAMSAVDVGRIRDAIRRLANE